MRIASPVRQVNAFAVTSAPAEPLEIEDAEEAMTYVNEFIKAVDEEFESVK